MKALFFAIFLFTISYQLKAKHFLRIEKKDTATYKLFNKKGEEIKLSDFKGKVIYIDFWATWCGGCRKLFQLSDDIHKKLSKKQLKKIVFIYVSVDNDSIAWNNYIKELNVDGLHLISPANNENNAGSFFKVTGLPRYITINKKGELAQFIAKTPQQDGLLEDLIKLIEE
jgi:thiol-disulfide isomerase/thioredoxin